MSEEALTAGVGMATMAVYITLVVTYIISLWCIHTKAGKPGWAIFIPIYNVVVMLDICQRPLWWILLMLIPIVNIFIGLTLLFDLARVFDKSATFALGLLFLPMIFYPILGLGNSEYTG